MTKTERDALVRIIKSRFVILHEQLTQRRHEIEEMIRERLLEDVSEARHRAMNAMRALAVEAEELRVKAREIDEQAMKEGVEARDKYGGKDPLFRPNIQGTELWEWNPIAQERRVRDEVRKLTNEAGIRALSLREQEQQLIERVYTEALESEGAKELFEEIPTIDSLLPLPTNGGELTA